MFVRRFIKLGLAAVVVATLFVTLLLFFVPEHFLRRVSNFANVTVDGRPESAETYLGNPTRNEAEAYLLMRIPGEGNFLFNFEDGNFREVSSYEFVRIFVGAVMLGRMTNGPWAQPLDDANLNEFQIISRKRHTIIVRF